MKKIVLSLGLLLLVVNGWADNNFNGKHFPDGDTTVTNGNHIFINRKDFGYAPSKATKDSLMPFSNGQYNHYLEHPEDFKGLSKEAQILDPRYKPFFLEKQKDGSVKRVWNTPDGKAPDSKEPLPKMLHRVFDEFTFLDGYTETIILFIIALFATFLILQNKHTSLIKGIALILGYGWLFELIRYEAFTGSNWGGKYWANDFDILSLLTLVVLFWASNFSEKTWKFIQRGLVAAVFILTITSGNFLGQKQWGRVNASGVINLIPAWILNVQTPEMYGAKVNSVGTDATVPINTSIQAAIPTNAIVKILGNGTYYLNTGSVKVYSATGTVWNAFHLTIEGYGTSDGSTGHTPILYAPVTNVAALWYEQAKGFELSGLTLSGAVTFGANQFQANTYLASRGVTYTAGCLDLQWAMYGAIVGDPFPGNGSPPGSGAVTYTNADMAQFYAYTGGAGSLAVHIHDCGIVGFVAGFVNLTANDTLGDSTHLNNMVITLCEFELCNGGQQSDQCSADNILGGYCLAFESDSAYGAGNSNGWNVSNFEINTLAFLVDGASGGSNMSVFENGYLEGFWCVGFLGAPNSSRTYLFKSLNFNVFNGQSGTVRRDSFAVIGNQVTFLDCSFTSANSDNNVPFQFSEESSTGSRVHFIDCSWGNVANSTLPNGVANLMGEVLTWDVSNNSYLLGSTAKTGWISNDTRQVPQAAYYVCPNSTMDLQDGNLYTTPSTLCYSQITGLGNAEFTNSGTCTIAIGAGQANTYVFPGDEIINQGNVIHIETKVDGTSNSNCFNPYVLGDVTGFTGASSTTLLVENCAVSTNVNQNSGFGNIYTVHMGTYLPPFFATNNGTSILSNCTTFTSAGVTGAYNMSGISQYGFLKCSTNGKYYRIFGSGSGSITLYSPVTETASIVYPFDQPYYKFAYASQAGGNMNGWISIGGTSGYFLVYEPEQQAGNKVVNVDFNGYTNASSAAVTIPTPFLTTPSQGSTVTGAAYSMSTSILTVTVGASSTGELTFTGP